VVLAGLRRLWRRFRRDRSGVAAIELAIISPILLLIMVAMVDFGLVLYVRFNLNETVSASANYAIIKADDVSASKGAALAANLVEIMPANVNVTAVVNNGPTVTRTNGVSSPSGTASAADACYCPTGTGASVTWGGSMTCGAACSGGGMAGKFVTLNASVSHSPLFGNYGFVQNGQVTAFTIVQVK